MLLPAAVTALDHVLLFGSEVACNCGHQPPKLYSQFRARPSSLHGRPEITCYIYDSPVLPINPGNAKEQTVLQLLWRHGAILGAARAPPNTIQGCLPSLNGRFRTCS